MAGCTHKELLLLVEERREMVRCTRCHLLISKEELGGGCCPECLEQGRRHAGFEPVEPPRPCRTSYRCEQCGALIECG